MADDVRKKLDAIDLSAVTLEDLKKLSNSSLRDALLDIIRRPGDMAASGHQNHGSHTNHGTESSRFLDSEFIAKQVAAELRSSEAAGRAKRSEG